MAVLWRDAHVTERSTFDGTKQREALTRLQGDAGLDATKAARAVNLSYPQYNRYLWGKLPLRTDQLASFAAAYGIPIQDLAHALGLVEPDDPGWDFLAELRNAKPDDPDGAEQTYHTLATAPQYVQREVVKAILDTSRRDREDRERDGRPGQVRSVAEQQAHYRIGATG